MIEKERVLSDFIQTFFEKAKTNRRHKKNTTLNLTDLTNQVCKSHIHEGIVFNEEEITDLEITWGMSGVINTNYNWELKLEDPNGVVPALVIANATQSGFFNTTVTFDSGNNPSTWGVGWMQARVTNISLAPFFGPGLATEGELNLYVEGPQGYANVGCDVRFFSP